jgi:hypothetical protein
MAARTISTRNASQVRKSRCVAAQFLLLTRHSSIYGCAMALAFDKALDQARELQEVIDQDDTARPPEGDRCFRRDPVGPPRGHRVHEAFSNA